MPMDLICRGCGGAFMETNDEDGWLQVPKGQIPDPRVKAFSPDREANGAMFRLKDHYRGLGWSCFPHDTSQIRDALECPSCGTPYPNASGKVLVQRRGSPKKRRAANADG